MYRNQGTKTEHGTDMQLTERDWKILLALEKWGVLGLGQALGLAFDKEAGDEERVRFFFNETTRRDYGLWYCKRLRRMVQAGYIRAHFMVNERVIYTLTETGFEHMKSRGRNAMPGHRGEIAPNLVNHEINVAAVGLVLSELFSLRVRTERERIPWLGSGGRGPAPHRGISDLWISGAAPRAIEVELSQKSRHDYQEIWNAYSLRRKGDFAVLYLTRWPHGVQTILSLARDFQADLIYACGLKDFRRSHGRRSFESYIEGRTLSLAHGAATAAAGASFRNADPGSSPVISPLPAGEKGECVI